MRRLLPVLLAIGVSLIPATLFAQVSWPMYQANAAHTGYIPVSFDPNDFTLDWEVTLAPNGQDVNPVAAVGGRVFASLRIYFENNQDDFFALDAEDGSILWSKDFGDVFSVNPPAYDGGQVYLQVGNHGSDTHLYTYNAASGALIHDGPHAAQWERYFAPTIVGGTAYINGGYYGGMYAFNFMEEPDRRWFIPLNQYDEWTPAVDGIYAYAYTGEYDPKLSVIRCRDGVEEFSIPDPNFEWHGWSMDMAPVLGGQNDVLVIQDLRLISFDLGTRSIRYEIDDGFGHSRYNSYAGQPSLAKGVIYAINNSNLEARRQSDGALLWSWVPPFPYRVEGTVIVTDTHVLLFIIDEETWETPGEGSAIHAIDLTTHQSVWSHHFQPVGVFEHAVGGEIAWSEGRLYFARDDGVLTAFKLLNPYEQSSVLQFETTAYAVPENSGVANVTLRRSGAGEGTVGVTVTSEDGTAIAGTDYTAVNQVVTWADGDTADRTVQVPISNDTETEGVEFFGLRLHSVTGPTTLGVLNRAQLTILDDETDVVRFSSATIDAGENAGTVSLYVVRDGPATGEVTVEYAAGGGSASPGSDYLPASGTLVWGDGDTGSKTIPLSIVNDAFHEDDETVVVALSEPTGAAIVGSPSAATVTIVDDDGPRLQFSSVSYQAAETGGSVELTVKRFGGAAGAVSVDWATADGTAAAGADYLADSGTLSWADGDATDRAIVLTVLDDADVEGGEQFQVILSNPVGEIALGQPVAASVSIADDEATEFLIPTETEFGQLRPRLSMNGSGSAVAVWDSWRQDGDQWGVYGQRLDGDGAAVGGEFRVNQTTDEDQMDGAVAVAADGSFVVVWEADVSAAPRIMGRRYDAAGTPLGGEFMINSSPPGTQTDPRVACDGDGRFMVVWSGRDASGPGAVGRAFAADGSPLGNELLLNTTTYLAQSAPAVAGRPGGGFVTVWESYGQDDYDSDAVVARVIGADGGPVGGEFRVNSTTEGNQSYPDVAVSGSGAILVVWEDDTGLDGAFGSIRGQWYDAAASPAGGEFQVNAVAAGYQGRPAVAADQHGRAAVVWEGRNNQDGSDIGVFGRTLFDDGTMTVGEIQFNTYTADRQYLPDVAVSGSGRMMAAWTSEFQDGSAEGVYGVSWPLPPAVRIFADGFESGHMTSWSASSP